jgi:hypothetical protein
VGAAVIINSAYRHPVLNEAVDGARNSQHIAGRAADIRTSRMLPLDLARIALEELGCAIGIGLGRNSIHVDLRGQLASWRYDGAALSESEFDQWVRDTCSQLGRQRTMRAEYAERVVPTIIGPERYAVDNEAPTFYIDPGLNTYYAIEVATHPDLLNRQHAAERTPENFYGSWATEGLREAHGATTYTLPADVWKRLRTTRRLYYRVITSSTSVSQWSNVQHSTTDQQAFDALWIELVGKSRQDRDELSAIAPLNPRAIKKADEALWRV